MSLKPDKAKNPRFESYKRYIIANNKSPVKGHVLKNASVSGATYSYKHFLFSTHEEELTVFKLKTGKSVARKHHHSPHQREAAPAIA